MDRPSLLVGLIGTGIQRSRSPAMHMAEARALGLDLRYDLIDLTSRGVGIEALPSLLDEVEASGFAGVNITHPCKQRVIPLLDELSDDVDAIGAVNTVVFEGGRRKGYNTDWSGFLRAFQRGLPNVPLGTVLQMGTGGAGAAVAHAALHLGIGKLLLNDLDEQRSLALARSLNERAEREFAIVENDLPIAMSRSAGLINATPIGMAAHPGSPVDVDLITPRHWVADVVYFPLETELLAQCRAKGCRVLDGGGMAAFQAAVAFQLFTGVQPDADRMLNSLYAGIADHPEGQ